MPSSHTTSVPFVKKEEFQCIDVDDEGFITVITPGGDTRSDLKLPSEMSPAPPGMGLEAQLADIVHGLRPCVQRGGSNPGV